MEEGALDVRPTSGAPAGSNARRDAGHTRSDGAGCGSTAHLAMRVPRRSRLFSGIDGRRITQALCIVAHSDDIEYFCGGTVLLFSRRGVRVDFVLATSGDKGTADPTLEGAKLAARREREQTAAAHVLGAQLVAFLRHRDAELIDTLEFRGELVREIRQSRPTYC